VCRKPKQDKETEEPKGGIYIHIPFCIQKCLYCDFYSITDLSLCRDFLGALETEIRIRGPLSKRPLKNIQFRSSSRKTKIAATGIHEVFRGLEVESNTKIEQKGMFYKGLPRKFDTLYIGGGTPSVLPPDRIEKLLETIHKHFRFVPDAEITIEVNPGTIDQSVMKQYRKIGINRISIGVQSFSERNLRFLGRIHSARDAVKAIQEARKADFSNLSLDLIYGLPGQTLASWKADLETALNFAPEHLSCYMLTYEPDTPLASALKQKRFFPLKEKISAALFMSTREFLEEKEYIRYEISNYSFKGIFPSRHNRKYWSFHPYTGLGPSAHSFAGGTRSWNHRSVNRYIENLKKGILPVENEEFPTEEQRMIETIYLGLRQTDGIDLENFHATFNKRFEKIFEGAVKILQNKKYLKMDRKRCYLTPRGMLLLDGIAEMFSGTDFETHHPV
jgi:oxygen-independent coproporphyrinogen-3 oxidase